MKSVEILKVTRLQSRYTVLLFLVSGPQVESNQTKSVGVLVSLTPGIHHDDLKSILILKLGRQLMLDKQLKISSSSPMQLIGSKGTVIISRKPCSDQFMNWTACPNQLRATLTLIRLQLD